jgi:hypothetical protein
MLARQKTFTVKAIVDGAVNGDSNLACYCLTRIRFETSCFELLDSPFSPIDWIQHPMSPGWTSLRLPIINRREDTFFRKRNAIRTIIIDGFIHKVGDGFQYFFSTIVS